MAERNTMQKTAIYDALCCLADHPTADQVYDTVREKCPNISRATVYRVLNRFAEKGVITKVSVNNGADHFDHQTHPHYHVCCIRCGKVCDAELPYINGLEKQVCASSGYKVTGYSIQFDGICPECMGKEEKESGQ